jgi:demethylmacrocin O-methyltransferase
MNSLEELAKKFGTDKQASQHNYTPMYEEWMECRREDSVNLVEIGIGPSGASARMWREYFSHGTILMIDDYTEFGGTPKEIEGVSILRGHQADPEVWENIPDGLDFVIDDGSHKPNDCIASVTKGFSKLKSGGLWFIEDTHCNFTPVFSDKDILYPWIFDMERNIQFSNLGTGDFYKSCQNIQGLDSIVYSIHMYKSVIVLQRS